MNRLQETRVLLGLTQPQVSAKLKSVEPRADVGMVSRYEKGVCLPTKDQLSALEDLYGVPRTELFDLEDLDLLGIPSAESEPTEESEKPEKAPPPSHAGRFRKCYRISREFAASLPDRSAPGVRVLLLAELARRGPQAAAGRIRGEKSRHQEKGG